MTQNEILDFLNSGALIRLPSGKVRLWKGPFQPTELSKNPIFSLAYMDFFGSQLNALATTSPVIETEVSTLRTLLQSHISETPFPAASFLPPSLDQFQESFQTIQGKIHRGEIEKAVPVVFSQSPLVPNVGQRARMLHQILEAHPDLYVYGYWSGSTGVLGATPEILFQMQDKQVKTMALAGTHPRADDQALLKDPKELKEHQIVIKDIKERLEKLGWVKIHDTHVAEYGILSHLRTWIEAETSGVSVGDLVKRLHPTAALGVFPRNYGLAWMQNLPYQEQRGIFGAPFVFSLSHSESIALVAIRCLQWSENGSQIGTGCGLVESSDLQKEWRELALKRESVMKVLGLAL
jgi:isochorismate synthase EntC